MNNWIKSFGDKELYAPYIVDTDNDYYPDLRKRLSHFGFMLVKANADDESIRIAKEYSNKVCEAIRDYYGGKVSTCHLKIEHLVKKCLDCDLAVSSLMNSKAFPGNGEIQFFRARREIDSRIYEPHEMLHRPYTDRAKYGNYRFSIPGIACLYLANSSYGCWIEMGKPSEHDFNVSPVVLNGEQKILNLAVMTRICISLNDGDAEYVHCWIRLLILMIATSYRINEVGRTLRSEYIVSQGIMLACRKYNIDGVAYFSKRVNDELFSFQAINLALFAECGKTRKYGTVCDNIKIDESMNYQLFRQLDLPCRQKQYKLRADGEPFLNMIGRYRYVYRYNETCFMDFDRFLFGRWKDKDDLPWGNAVKDYYL